MMQTLLDQYVEIGEFLQDGISLDQLVALNTKLNEEHFYIPIIGQFSSGKSSLINNILGRRILPSMLSETTAYTTLLYYGETEYAEIIAHNETYRFELEKLMELSQRNLQSDASVSEILGLPTVNNSDILCINVYINNPLLQSGIVFIDTPGLNTIISKHEQRTIDILPKAHSIIYIMRKALTAADVRLVSIIDQMGIELTFVRTKMDELRRDENDTPRKIMQQDKEQLEAAIGRSASYFGVTNEEELFVFPQWKTLMDELVHYLQSQFVQNIDKKRIESISLQLQKIKTVFLENLEERKAQLSTSKNVTDQHIERKILSLQEEMGYVNSRVNSEEKNFRLAFDATKQVILTKYDVEFKAAAENFRQELNYLTTVESLQDKVETIVEQQIASTTEALKSYTNDMLNTFLEKAAKDTNAALQDDIEKFTLGEMETIHLTVDVPSITEVFEKGEFIQEKLADESGWHKKRLLEIEQKRLQIDEQEQAIYGQLEQARVEKQQLGTYEARYVEKHNTDSEETLSTLGNVIDWALVFIPGKAFATGAAKAAGAINKVAKGTKYVEQAAKVAGSVIKAGEFMSKTDKFKDVVKSLEATQNSFQRNDGNGNRYNVFNLLSLEHWFGQVGKMIDGPAQIIEDEHYRTAYLQEKSQIESKIEHAKQLEMLRMQSLNLLETREEKIREEMRLQEKYNKQLQQQMYEADKRHEQKMREQQVITYRQQLVRSFDEQLNSLAANYLLYVQHYLERFISHMPAVISLSLQQRLHGQKQQLENLLSMRQENKEEQMRYEAQLSDYIQILNG